MKTIDFERAKVVPSLPATVAQGRDAIPSDLVGAEIIAFGTLAGARAVEGGGLVIDYRRKRERQVRHIVLGFNELGMWVEFRGFPQSAPILPDFRNQALRWIDRVRTACRTTLGLKT